MTKRTKKIQNSSKDNTQQCFEASTAVSDLVRHMARRAAEVDYPKMLEAAKNKNKLIADWENQK